MLRERRGRDFMMPRRQEAFRADYRTRISPWYSGLLHVFVVYAIGAAALAYAIPRIHNPSWLEWFVVPVGFLATNAVEWGLPRFFTHRPLTASLALYPHHPLPH